MAIQVRSSAFAHGAKIPVRYTLDGENVSPPLAWSSLPEGTRQVAILVDDPDAPKGPFVHWVAYHLKPQMGGIPEGASRSSGVAREGRNSMNHVGYDGPAPPPGGTHHYHFHVFALDEEIASDDELDKDALLAAISGHILDEGELVGTYERSSKNKTSKKN